MEPVGGGGAFSCGTQTTCQYADIKGLNPDERNKAADERKLNGIDSDSDL